ncbi:MAG: alkaline phosphatase family protein [Thermoanaerobaculia bacterium]|nr:alkaline phosphatase family protein [Thermoanaerobaculia bacterium]
MRTDSRPPLAEQVRRSSVAGLVHGSLLYGGVISFLHVLHNQLPSAWSSVVLFLGSSLLYGVGCAAVFAAVALTLETGRYLIPGRRGDRADHDRAPDHLTAGAFVFNLAFWFLVANYGLTYDQMPFGEHASAPGMLAWIALRTLFVAGGSFLVAWLFARGWRTMRQRKGKTFLIGAYGTLLALHVGLAILYDPPTIPPADPTTLPDPAALRPPRKVVLLAADGADWRVMEPLVEAGEMPNLDRLMARGVHGPLESLPGTNSPVLWASIYTGLEPAEHRLLDFFSIRLPGMIRGVYPVHRTFFKESIGYLEEVGLAERTTVNRDDLYGTLIWEVASALGRSIGVVDGYYYSFPAPPMSDPESYFVAYGADRFYSRASEGPRPLSARQEAEDYARPPELLDRLGPILSEGEFRWQSRALLELLELRPQPDFLNFYSHQPDAVQHGTWRSFRPRRYLPISREGDGEEDDFDIFVFHREFDRFLGKLVERVEPGTVILLVSDHGHSPTLFHAVDTMHRHGPPGVFLMVGGPARRGVRISDAHLYDVFPTVLHLLGLPVPQTAAGRVLDEAFSDEFRETTPVARVASYEALLPIFHTGSGSGDPVPKERQDEELEKLRALGYIR